MNLITPTQILRRIVLSRRAVYLNSIDLGSVARSHATRILHLLLILCVINQLGSDHFMHRPMPGDSPWTLYIWHEYMGLVSFGLVLIFWLWTLIRHGETKIGRLFPWFSPSSVKAVILDALAQAASLFGVAPLHEGSAAFASAVHGLGLLTLTGMAATGTVYFVTRGSILGHDAMRLHHLISNLMWAYLFGHAAIAVLHHALGQDIIKRMFWINRGTTITKFRDKFRSNV